MKEKLTAEIIPEGYFKHWLIAKNLILRQRDLSLCVTGYKNWKKSCTKYKPMMIKTLRINFVGVGGYNHRTVVL